MINRVFKSTYFYSIVSKGSHILLGILISAFVNRALGPELKGEYAYIANLVSMISIIGGIGIYQLYPYYLRSNKTKQTKLKFINLTLHLSLIYVFISIIVTLVVMVTVGVEQGAILVISSFICITSIGSTQLLMFASIEDFKCAKVANVIAYIVKFLLMLNVFLVAKKSVWAVLLVDFAFNVVSMLASMLILQFRVKAFRFDWKFLWEILKKGCIPMLFSLLLTLNYKIDVIYMKTFTSLPLAQIGIYSVGIQLAEYIWTIPDIFKEVLYSKTARETNVKEVLWCMRLSFYIELIFLVFIFVFGDKVLVLLYGAEYVDAINVTKLIFSGVLAMTLFKLLTPIYNAKGTYLLNLLILFASVCINVILNFILIPSYGISGAAFASVGGYFVCGIIYLIRFSFDYKVPIYKAIFFSTKELRELIRGERV